ncbi:hypothetical protein LPMP_010600 [Leishmania panamensis]|uniref:Rab-GTPase-TBC domain-containing protein, putative n=1 Tax=Leishmania panamensis TaxID=5679 RepID=A0A088RHE0_LEIPA|nr:hypothetical protein LPMP_010600 [Leishmania panamensis]AIN95160.1 hypothetical protein LPMP_010600 [Leishmania panamensis]
MDSPLPTRLAGVRTAGCASPAPRSSVDTAPPLSRSELVDIDGLRCEVRSMRSVPHALYSTPFVSRIVAMYVQQLIDDFTRSLLLCRPVKRCLSSSSRRERTKGGDSQQQRQQQQSSTAAKLSAVESTMAPEDEEMYLLLRLCALDKAAQQQQQSLETSGGDPPAVAGPQTRAAAEQLVALFAAAERGRCRDRLSSGARGEDSERRNAAAKMPPLLSSLSRFRPMLHDMRYLAQHLLLPRHAWQYHQREWVIVYEDVAVTLRDRLSRCRRAAIRRGGRDGKVNEEDGTEDRGAARSPRATADPITDGRQLFPVAELELLWHTLWELLGAAWRQRDRLWGAYRHLHGPRRLSPLCLSGQAPYAVPPGVHACPILRELDEGDIARVHASAPSPLPHAMPAAPTAAHAEDSCAFGPFTSVDIGVSARRLYVLRQPLAAVLRSLRVSVPPAGRDPLVTSTTAFAGFQYVDGPVRRGQTSTLAPTVAAAAPLIVPLFDVTDQDAGMVPAAVPYMSPEVYMSLLQEQRQQQQRRATSRSASPSPPMVSWPPAHTFSDDLWNAAVVVLEAALSGFCAMDESMCHLAPLPPAPDSDADRPDPPTVTSGFSCSPRPSPSVYSDVLRLLTERHVLPSTAAHNFLYAALYHLQAALSNGGRSSGEDADHHLDGDVDGVTMHRDGDGNRESTAAMAPPSPARLAGEWRRYLSRAYGPACVKEGGILAEVAAKGLCWRRSERWNVFGMAHGTAVTTRSTAASLDSLSPASLFTPRDVVGTASNDSSGGGGGGGNTRAATAAFAVSIHADPSVDIDGDDGALPSSLAAAHGQRSSQPGIAGVAEGDRDMTALSRLPHRFDRVFNTLDTPLLRLLSLGQCSAAVDGGDLWVALASYLRRCTRTAVATGTSAAATGSPGTPARKANGAVAEAADVDCVDELLRLLFCCVVRTTRRYRANFADDAAGKGDVPAEAEWCEYAAINHPFFRGFAERGLLTTYMAVACCGGELGDSAAAAAAATLPALNLYVPAAALLATVREMEATWKASGIDVCTERVVKQANSLRALIGDDMRAWESSTAARGGRSGTYTHQQQQQYLLLMNSLVNMSSTLMLPPPVDRARRALEGVLSPIDFDLAAQLQHTQQLRCLLYGGSSDATGDDRGRGGKAAQNTGAVAAGTERVRAYLKALLMPDTVRRTDGVVARVAYSPFYPLPPTLRGEVWGRLLSVPPSARTREALLACAVHRTAAKPTPYDRQLSVDIPRCHAYHPLLSSSYGAAQLQRILRAWLHLHPSHSYWQGLDSVCAVLLTVSNRDEALVLAQLNAIVDRFIAHEEDGESPHTAEGGSGDSRLGSPRVGSAALPLRPAKQKPTVAAQLRHLMVVLRYCDPLLAHYLFDILSCTPELYAISWLLTLFSHSLPVRKVYPLWDLLFVEGDTACLVVLCATVIIHKRDLLLSTDFSGCLAAFSSGASAMNVAAAVGDTRWLMTAVPPSVLAPPPVSSDTRRGVQESLYGSGRDGAAAAINCALRSDDGNSNAAVALLAVEDVSAALAVSAPALTATSDGGGCTREKEESKQQWFHSGLYLVDLREQPAENALQEAVLGAISVPLYSAARPRSHASAADAAAERGAALQHREVVDVHTSAFVEVVDEVDNDAAGTGWGIVEQQERLHEQQRAEQDAAARQVEDAAAAIVRYVDNPAMAAILSRMKRTAESVAGAPPQPPSLSCPWPVHPIVQKASCAPHVVLLTSGNADEHELPLAHQLGVKLNACGVHNVSILRGGVASLRRALPELVVRRMPSL